MKRIIVAVILALFIVVDVNASNVFYTNVNGVSFDEVQYNNIIRIYGEYYIDLVTQEEFNNIQDIISDTNIEITKLNNSTNNNPLLRSYRETNSKYFELTKVSSTSNLYLIVSELTWKKMPSVRSYDVMGMRIVNGSFSGDVYSKMLVNGTDQGYSSKKKQSNGFGFSMKLPSSASSLKMTQSCRVTDGTTVYASYQHAVSSISLATSENYTFGASGLGAVFIFQNNSLFDQMGGISITV